jgi:penicillin-binding protein 1A
MRMIEGLGMKEILHTIGAYSCRWFEQINRWFGKVKTSRVVVWLCRHRKARIAIGVSSIVCVPILVLAIMVMKNVPNRAALTAIRNPVASEVYTADSVLIGRYFIQDRTHVRYKDISPHVISALIATEDARFFKHHGVDARSLGRVIFKTILLQHEGSGGGSTITQQLAKNLFPREEYHMFSIVVNKLREAVIAWRLENIYSKEEILTLYLNTIPFGDNTYGIQSAAHRFFSVKASALTETQAAVLVGMLKATHYYNPRLFPEKSLARRNVVLSQMVRYNRLSEERADSLRGAPLKLAFGAVKRQTEIAPYFRESLRAELEKWFDDHRKEDGSAYNLFTDGLKIFTTIDSKLQSYAEKAVAKQMAELQKEFSIHWGKEKPWDSNASIIRDAIRRTSRYKSMNASGVSEEEIMTAMNKPVSMRLFDWKGAKEMKVSPVDSIKHHLMYLNAGFLAMDPVTGNVKAWVGGINHDYFQFDHVSAATRQVGSIFKPIVFAQAIEQGVSPCELIPAGQETYIDDEGEEWTPKNSNYDYPVQYSMRGALAYSVNTVSVKLIQRAGIGKTVRLAKAMGIESRIPYVPSIALGSSAISLLEMTGAYATFSNNGVAAKPTFISAVIDRDGNVLNDFKSEITGRQVMSAEAAQLVRQMLKTVVDEGTASRLRWKYGVYNDVAAKTGTTNSNSDGWFVAVTPKLVMGTWVGADDPRVSFRSTLLGQGSNTALPIVAHFLKAVNGDRSYKEIAKAKFAPLKASSRTKLNCDLYELDDTLWTQIEKTVQERDSIIMADTLAEPPAETFLQGLYKRKQRVILASQRAGR